MFGEKPQPPGGGKLRDNEKRGNVGHKQERALLNLKHLILSELSRILNAQIVLQLCI